MEITTPFVYRLRNTGRSSKHFGPCEVCGQHATEVFLQVEARPLGPDALLGRHAKPGAPHVTYEGCRDGVFGHEACLKSIQNAGGR